MGEEKEERLEECCQSGLYWRGDCMADASKCKKSPCDMWDDTLADIIEQHEKGPITYKEEVLLENIKVALGLKPTAPADEGEVDRRYHEENIEFGLSDRENMGKP